MTDDQEMIAIGGNGQDAFAVLDALADALDAPASVPATNGEVKRPAQGTAAVDRGNDRRDAWPRFSRRTPSS